MKYAIIGAGAMGSIVGAYLVKGENEVWLVDPFEAHMKAISENGLKIEVNGETETVKVNAVTGSDQISDKMDVIIFLVKGLYTREAAESALCLANEDTYVMTVQNGIGNVDIFSEYFNPDKILYGLIQFGGSLVEPGHVYALIGANQGLKVGPNSKVLNEKIEEIAESFRAGGMHFELMEDIDGEVWYKMTKNCSNNAVCGIVRLPLGPYMAAKEAKQIGEELLKEVIAVAKAKGIKIKEDPPKAQPKQGESKGGGGMKPDNPMYNHLPSTAQDMSRERITEIDFLNGAVVREAEKFGVPTPFNKLVTLLVKVIEQNYEKCFYI